MGVTESILLYDPFVLALLLNYTKRMRPGDRLAAVSPGVLRQRLASLLAELKITAPYRWYTVRRGGATHSYYSTSNNLSAICARGRWNSLKTARIYICDAVAQLSELTLPARTTRKLQALATQCRPSFCHL